MFADDKTKRGSNHQVMFILANMTTRSLLEPVSCTWSSQMLHLIPKIVRVNECGYWNTLASIEALE